MLTRKGGSISPQKPSQQPVGATPEPVYILRVPGHITDEHREVLCERVHERTGIYPLVLDSGMQLEVVDQTYYKTSDHLPPIGHHVLIWTGDVWGWDIARRKKYGDTWRWLLIEEEGVDYPIKYWAYLPHPPLIEVEAIDQGGVR